MTSVLAVVLAIDVLSALPLVVLAELLLEVALDSVLLVSVCGASVVDVGAVGVDASVVGVGAVVVDASVVGSSVTVGSGVGSGVGVE